MSTELQLAEALDALEVMVKQHCRQRVIDDYCTGDHGSEELAANAFAVHVLAQHGRLEIRGGLGGMKIFRWIGP